MPKTAHDDLIPWLRLLLTSGIGPQAARKLLAAFGSAQAIFQQSISSLGQIVSARQAQALAHAPEGFEQASQALASWLNASATHHVLTLEHPKYPKALLEIPDPPFMLYASGQLELLCQPALAVVGSRNPTPQGEETARDFARTFSQHGITVVSGLAQGIDGISQAAALEASGSTIAVLGTGIDRVYPASHYALAHQIAQHGLLLSDYPLGTPPIAANFPKRNRIIAGLSAGVLVVEATLRSGSLITAKLAADMGKDVFAIPGSIHSPQAKGCHWLIRQGAKLVETAQDILEELHFPALPSITKPASDPVSTSEAAMTPDNKNIVLHAIGEGPTSFDAIAARTGMNTATLQAELLTLELNQQIARLPGGFFQRLHLA